MKWGVQVNIGGRGTPDWRWLHDPDFLREEYPSKTAAEAAMLERWAGAKSRLFRIEQIDEGA